MSRLGLSFCFCFLPISVIPSIIAQHGTISPRQEVSASVVSAIPSTTSSSFNWWPYPTGGVTTTTTSTSLPLLLPTLVPLPFSPKPNASASPNSSTNPISTTLASYTLARPLLRTTAAMSSPSPPPSGSLPPNPQTLLNSGPTPHTPIWLIPICLLSGAVIGCAIGWLAWRRCSSKRDRQFVAVGNLSEKYAWAYKYDTEREHEHEGHDKDMEHGGGYEYGQGYMSSGSAPLLSSVNGRGPVYRVGVEQDGRRAPSTASTSGAQAAHPHPQARKRSGAAVVSAKTGRLSTNQGSEHEHEETDDVHVRSPLLTLAVPSEVHVLQDSKAKPLPASPLPLPYSYGDDDREEDGVDVPYECIRHKSVRRRIWERLGFAEAEMGLGGKNNNHKVQVGDSEADGRQTWSAGAVPERAADVGRSLSWWGRRKSMRVKEGRVERWVRSVRGENNVLPDPEPARRQGLPVESVGCEEVTPELGTPELVLSTLRRISPSPSAWHSRENFDLALAFDEKSPEPVRSTLAAHSATTPPGQRRSIRHHDTEQRSRSRGVSLQDPGPVSGSDSVSAPRRSITRTTSTSRNAFPSRSSTSNGSGARATPSSRSQRSHRGGIDSSSPTPPSPSSVSRYSATPHVPALSTLNRSPTRTPTRITPTESTVPTDFRTTLTRAVPSSRLARSRPRPVSTSNTTTPPRNSGSGMPLRTRPLPPRGIPQSQPPLSAEFLPIGPSSVTSPPLQSALCFDSDGTLPVPPSRASHAPTASTTGMARTKVLSSSPSSSAHTRKYSAKRVSDFASGSTRPSTRPASAAIPPDPDSRYNSRYQSTVPTPVPQSALVPADRPSPKPFSPKERYLARQNANARVGMILSRSYSSRNFEERPVSPTMFGAVISEEVESGHGYSETFTFQTEGGEGIEQRLERLRNLKH